MFSEKDQTITLHGFNAVTKEYCGSFEYFWAVGTGLAANSTQLDPLEHKQGFTIIYDEDSASWSYIKDLRGTKVFSTSTQQESEIDYIGPIKEGFTTIKPTSFFETWTGEGWADQRTAEEKEAERLKQFTPLTRRQFKLALLENSLLETVEQTIAAIEDPTLKTRIQIEYNESERFERSNESVQYMLGLLSLTAEQVDEMWLYAATL